jgi:ATP-dependent helicase HrpB
MVRQACGIDQSLLATDLIEDREELFFNPTRKQVEARRRRYWFDLMLSEQTATISDEQQCQAILVEEACKNLDRVLPDEKSAFHGYIMRLRCLRDWAPELELPSCDEDFLKELLQDLCPNKRSLAELKSAAWLDWLKAKLSPEQQRAIEKECPEKMEVPSGNRIKLEYAVGKPPVLAVRIQEVFSWTTTPRVAFGRIPILLHLLAPNFRPQQVTDDLQSFWANTYEVVRKELRRRYPKHSWPEDPLTAKPESKGGRRR